MTNDTAKVSPELYAKIIQSAQSSRMSRSAFVRESVENRIDRPIRIIFDGRIRIMGVLVHVEVQDGEDETSIVFRGSGRDKLRNALLSYLKASTDERGQR